MAIKLLLLFIISFKVYSFEVRVDINPMDLRVDEEFDLIFKIESKKSTNPPEISFFADGLMELDRNQSKSISTSYSNGNFSRKVQYRFIYRMMASKKKKYEIKNISIKFNGVVKKLPNKIVDFKTSTSRRKYRQDYFLRAEASKRDVYVNEGFNVNYYLYTKVGIRPQEIKKFPLFNNFVKRFYKLKNIKRERVSVNGEVYERSLRYSVRLYPTKSGDLTIDSLKMRILILGGQNPFGFSGIFFGGSGKSRVIASPKVKIKVKEIPLKGISEKFSELVGEHKFNFKFNKKKYIVGEIIEGELEVEGEGLLENMEELKIFQTPELEEFDVRNKFIETQKDVTRKLFQYTWIGNKQGEYPEKIIPILIFDPQKKQLIEKNIKIPGIEVRGTSVISNFNSKRGLEKSENREKSFIKKRHLLSPKLFSETKREYLNIKNIAIIFLILNVILVGIRFFSYRKRTKYNNNALKIVKKIKKNGLNYRDVYSFLLEASGKESSLEEIIKELSLSYDCKMYFTEILKSSGAKNFSKEDVKNKSTFEKKYFYEVLEKVQKKNEKDRKSRNS